MNTNGTTGAIPIRLQNANPLLFTLQQDHMTIQPYWIMVLQMLAIQLVQRVWNSYKYGEFLLTLEIVILRLFYLKQVEVVTDWVFQFIQKYGSSAPKKNQRYSDKHRRSSVSSQSSTSSVSSLGSIGRIVSLSVIPSPRRRSLSNLPTRYPSLERFYDLEEKYIKMGSKLKFDFMDFLLYFLPLFGHGIWYCYIQSSCISAEKATAWNCYNAFGYRLYNYTFVSYFNFLCNFVMKIIVIIYRWHKIREENSNGEKDKPNKHKVKFNIFNHLGFCSCVIIFLFNGALILPYIFTHVIPMLFIYIFMSIIHFGVWIVLVSSSFLIFFNNLLPTLVEDWSQIVTVNKFRLYPVLFITSLGVYSYPILLSTLYNYSQYFYYGEDYFKTMTNEFDTRDTRTYINVLTNSVNEKLHTALDFF